VLTSEPYMRAPPSSTREKESQQDVSGTEAAFSTTPTGSPANRAADPPASITAQPAAPAVTAAALIAPAVDSAEEDDFRTPSRSRATAMERTALPKGTDRASPATRPRESSLAARDVAELKVVRSLHTYSPCALSSSWPRWHLNRYVYAR
jgi:hypothetical protein